MSEFICGIRVPDDDEYLTPFHKQWNEACMRERIRTMSSPLTHEILKENSARLAEKVRLEEERLRLERIKNRKKH